MRRALPTLVVALVLALPGVASAAAVDGDGMWIWYVSKSSGGNLDQIQAKAQEHNVKTVYIKSADGVQQWRPLYPLGQTYANPKASDVLRFRKLGTSYGARGISWWVWQFSGTRQWNALGSPFEPFGLPPRRDTLPLLTRGNRSDLVVWAQQHL